MCDRNIITSNGEKLYLIAFELFSGQYGQIFYKAFYARNEEKLQKEVHKYLRDYYDRGNVTEIDGMFIATLMEKLLLKIMDGKKLRILSRL